MKCNIWVSIQFFLWLLPSAGTGGLNTMVVLGKIGASCHREVLQESIPGSSVLWVPEVYLSRGWTVKKESWRPLGDYDLGCSCQTEFAQWKALPALAVLCCMDLEVKACHRLHVYLFLAAASRPENPWWANFLCPVCCHQVIHCHLSADDET